MTAGENSIARNTIRLVAVAPILFIAFGSVIVGIVLFFHLGASERDFNAKMESIRSGKVAPETLTVIDKYINPSRHGSGKPHVICRGSHSPRINFYATRPFYDSVALGSLITGYYFPDGYFVPQSQAGDAGIAKWIFLGGGFMMGGMMFAYGISQFRRLSADTVRLAAPLKARADMAKRNP